MPTRTAHTAWTGGCAGVRPVELSAAKSAPRREVAQAYRRGVRRQQKPGGTHRGGALVLLRDAALGADRRAGGTPKSLDVTADVSFGPDPAGGFHIPGIKLTVRGHVDGLDASGFEAAAQEAKEGCPVSKALTGTAITLDAGWPARARPVRMGSTRRWVHLRPSPVRSIRVGAALRPAGHRERVVALQRLLGGGRVARHADEHLVVVARFDRDDPHVAVRPVPQVGEHGQAAGPSPAGAIPSLPCHPGGAFDPAVRSGRECGHRGRCVAGAIVLPC